MEEVLKQAARFKPGDKVMLIRDGKAEEQTKNWEEVDGLVLGGIYTVKHVSTKDNEIIYIEEGSHGLGLLSKKFILLSDLPFKDKLFLLFKTTLNGK